MAHCGPLEAAQASLPQFAAKIRKKKDKDTDGTWIKPDCRLCPCLIDYNTNINIFI